MRPFTRKQIAQNQAFLEALRRTGNPRLAAASLGVHRTTYSKRRARCAAFAADWDAAKNWGRDTSFLADDGRGVGRNPD
ncbi:MAG TPA: hypothetical protein VE053_02710 [Allosphingosinicella sp.]|nr:hypothetical protein [Allosphingosinicella sp.]